VKELTAMQLIWVVSNILKEVMDREKELNKINNKDTTTFSSEDGSLETFIQRYKNAR
jgi:hypothetical protein